MQKVKKIVGKFCYWMFAPKWLLNRGTSISLVLLLLFFSLGLDFRNKVLLSLAFIAFMAFCLSMFAYFYVVSLNQNVEDETKNTED